jgi:hypothetical protein
VNRLSESNIQFEAALAPGATNDTAATAEPIVPGLVFGFHTDDDSDFYSFVITSPSIVRFETIGYRNGIFAEDSDDYDMEISLYDTDGTTSLFNDDDSFFYDSAIQYQIETPGTYFIEVTECCGSGDAPYALSFSRTDAGGSSEHEPNEDPDTADSISYGGSITGSIDTGELDGFKFSGKAGDMVRVQIFDSYNSDVKSDEVFATIYAPDGDTELPTGGDGDFHTYTTILQETGTHFIVVEPWGGLTDYRVELTRFRAATYEHEPNDTIANANSLGSGGRSAGVIEPAVPGVADTDVFHFKVAKDRLTTIQIYASYFSTDSDGFFEYSGHGSDLEPDLRILDHEGTEIAYSTSDWSTVSTEDVIYGLPCAAVSFVAPASGRYYVEVTDAFGGFGSEYYYVIERPN